MRRLLLTTAALLTFGGVACAQTSVYGSGCSNCAYVLSGGTVVSPDEATLTAWAAKKAVSAQLDWFDEKKVEKLDRSDVDAMQARVDALCKWAKTLSNHIFAAAYAEWGSSATSKLEERRRSLDKIDVAKSLVTGLPTPPESKP